MDAPNSLSRFERRASTSDIQTAPQPAAPRHLPMPRQTSNPLLTAPVLGTLVRLSLPNMVAMLATALVTIAETAYVGLLGIPPLAGMALVFPMVMLQQMMSAGAMGGGVSSAISRAIGAADEIRAGALAAHATVIAILAGSLFTGLFLAFGSQIYQTLGGRGQALAAALSYSNIVFLGASSIWLTNTFASVIRGSGNMKVPSATILSAAGLQVVLGGGLGLGLGPLPKLGMVGIGMGQVIAFSLSALFLFWYMQSGRARLRISFAGGLNRSMFHDILRVGGVACISPLQSVLTVLILTRLVSSFGTEALAGYGIGTRLEFLLIPITFAIGVACVPMVGMAIGAGEVARARRVAWTGGALSAVFAGAVGLVLALMPDLWTTLFTNDPAVLASARCYFVWVGPTYAFFGLGLCLYFASQGAGRVVGPVIAGTIRLAVVALGGWWLATSQAPASAMFALIGLAMVAFGTATAVSVYAVRWGPKGR